MMTKIPSSILSQYLWYNANIKVDKTSIQFSKFCIKIFMMFHNFLITMASLKNDINLRQNIYLQRVQIKGYENATDLVTHDHYLIKGSRVT